MKKMILLPSIGLFFILLYIYAHSIEPKRLVIKNISIANPTLAKKLKDKKAILLSDLHIRKSTTSHLEELQRSIETIAPDIIFLTGDYITRREREASTNLAIQFLTKLEAPLGVFVSLGDADYIRDRLNSSNFKYILEKHLKENDLENRITILNNSETTVQTSNGQLIRLFGVDPSLRLTEAQLMLQRDKNRHVDIILSHLSNIFDTLPSSQDVLVLSGDTHGGQILLPAKFWQMLKYSPSPKYIHGLFREGKKSLYVTGGIGTSFLHFRLGVPPEIVVLDFY